MPALMKFGFNMQLLLKT